MSKNIDQLYKEKFDKFEASVPDGLWDKIEQNPKWQQHLRQQKIRNLVIYAGLAIVAIGSCIAILLRPTDNVEILTENDVVESIDEKTPVQVMETTVTEDIAIENSAFEAENNILVIEPSTTSTPTVESIGENTNIKPTINNIPNSDSTIPQNINTVPVTPETHIEKPQLPVENKNIQDTPVTKIEAEPSANPGTPQTPVPESNENHHQSPFSIPNAFTPNGDGLNDIFRPVTSQEIISYQLDIFMTNGQHIFSSKNIDYGWNGEFQGSLANGGTYIYIIKYKDSTGKEHIDKGQLLLMR